MILRFGACQRVESKPLVWQRADNKLGRYSKNCSDHNAARNLATRAWLMNEVLSCSIPTAS